MQKREAPFDPGVFFHVYSHGNAEDNIFREEENYHYFLKRYAYYILPVAQTYAFCLMPNHFHLLLQVRGREELNRFFKSEGKGGKKLPVLISKQFSNLLNAYSKAFNKKYNRRGKLFLKSLKRKPVKDDVYFTRLIWYIHQNPVLHGFVKGIEEWPYSSYQLILSQKKTKIEREELLKKFGSRKLFRAFHNRDLDMKGIEL
ncbi:MAG: hypothetical protein U5J95_11840 [Balneolaceae bacterium]|nr:hypothetical protein [Balneolaceae bacterium]